MYAQFLKTDKQLAINGKIFNFLLYFDWAKSIRNIIRKSMENVSIDKISIECKIEHRVKNKHNRGIIQKSMANKTMMEGLHDYIYEVY